nr:G-type lectin S-receptor-like serine/threonine-protein kinase At4g03230 [Ipomoea batatas]
MSPEYALDGLFSTKSDVFSFGVVVLEIVSGKKNSGFYHLDESSNLLGYAWRLWSEERTKDLVDQPLLPLEPNHETEVFKCINVGLLCVQEDPGVRPSMSNVLIMLGSDSMSIPRANQPAFVARARMTSGTSSSTSSSKPYSNNQMTITVQEPR